MAYIYPESYYDKNYLEPDYNNIYQEPDYNNIKPFNTSNENPKDNSVSKILLSLIFVAVFALIFMVSWLIYEQKNSGPASSAIETSKGPEKTIKNRYRRRETKPKSKRVEFNDEVGEKEFYREEPPIAIERRPVTPSFLAKINSPVELEKKELIVDGYGEACDETPCKAGLICTPSALYYVPDEVQDQISNDFANAEIYPLEIDILREQNSSIEDVAEFQGKLVIALANGNIIKYSDTEQTLVHSSKDIQELAVHNNMLYGMSKGTINSINIQMFNKKEWQWHELNTWPTDVISMEGSLDGRELFLKTATHAYYVSENRLMEKKALDEELFKIYGETANDFVILNNKGEAKIVPSDVTFNNVASGILLSNGRFMYLHQENTDLIQRIRQIQGEPVFISRAVCVLPNEDTPTIQL
jgi:hypothetical protein